MNPNNPIAPEDMTSDSSVATEMRLKYRQLFIRGVTDLERWREVHRMLPAVAKKAFILAAMASGPLAVAETLYAMTLSPAMLFVSLSDGVNYNEKEQIAAFRSVKSANAFRRSFPEWAIRTVDKSNIEDVRNRVLREGMVAYDKR